jgi:catalase
VAVAAAWARTSTARTWWTRSRQARNPQWELGIQTFPDIPDQTCQSIDLLDHTKILPEESAPVLPICLLTPNANPVNSFAVTNCSCLLASALPVAARQVV